jgi:glycosyltransferase involved in cell wall biosynthesis
MGHEVSIRPDPPPDRPDVLHAFGWSTVTALGYAGAITVASLDDPDGTDDATITAMRSCDRVIAPSSTVARGLIGLGLRRERLSVIPEGVDTGTFHAGPAGPRLHSDRSFARILCVRATLSPHSLLDVMIALRHVPDGRLFVAGGPPAKRIRRDPQAQKVADAARRVGVASRVFLLGEIPAGRRPDLYRSADVVLGTGEADAAQVALQAMASSVPVIAFATDAVADIIVHGVSGILVEPGDVNALAAALRGLLASEPRRYAYAVAGLSRVQERFTWPRVAEQIEGIYRLAIADRQSRTASVEQT